MKEEIKLKNSAAEEKFIKSYYDHVYFSYVEVVMCDYSEINDYLKKKKYDYSIKEGTEGCTINLKKDGQTKYFIWLKNKSLDILCHELIHLVHYVFEDTGVEINYNNSECFAYYYTFWFKKIFNDLDKFVIKNGK